MACPRLRIQHYGGKVRWSAITHGIRTSYSSLTSYYEYNSTPRAGWGQVQSILILVTHTHGILGLIQEALVGIARGHGVTHLLSSALLGLWLHGRGHGVASALELVADVLSGALL